MMFRVGTRPRRVRVQLHHLRDRGRTPTSGPNSPAHRPPRSPAGTNWRAVGPGPLEEIAFENVSFAYEDEPVLADSSMAVDRGEFVGIVGKSGGGKSTVVSPLTRLLPRIAVRFWRTGRQFRPMRLRNARGC
ncbi:hypothetical protein C9J85_03220 [Haloferax sp. wsp5]|nr:hypothetical protein C9J85_03220 [Haloferax sp. wsp5]